MADNQRQEVDQPGGSDSVARFRADFISAGDEIRRVIVGQTDIVDGVLIALLSGGHVLLEGVPGLGKTLLVKTLGDVLDLPFSRIQFTPDLMPADIVGTTLLVDDPRTGSRSFQFSPGPLFSNIVLADEINRATPKTQSALLEAMQEGRITVGGTTYPLETPFIVIATQNPIEMEGTYPLPEAQLDRFFFKLLVQRPSTAQLSVILDRTTGTKTPEARKILTKERLILLKSLVRQVVVADHLRDYCVRLISLTHPDEPGAPEDVKKFVRLGASPRGAQAVILAAKVRALLDGRFNIAYDDIRGVALPALRHRLILSFDGIAEGANADQLISSVLRSNALAGTVRSGK